MSIVLVDTVPECLAVAGALSSEPEIAVDIEGVNLCRTGQVSLIQVAAPGGVVYLFDIATLGQAAFDSGGLGAVLERPTVLKVIFDGRADNDALWHLHRVRMRQVFDLQILFALKFSNAGDRYVKGLQHCLDQPGVVPFHERHQMRTLKEDGKRLFAPECGGSYEVWKSRPLSSTLVSYAATDVKYLLSMKRLWGSASLNPTVQQLTEERIQKAVSSHLPAKGPHMAIRDFTLPRTSFSASSGHALRFETFRRSYNDEDDYDDSPRSFS